MPPDQTQTATAATWALLIGNLLIGTGVQLPIGLLDLIAADLGVTATAAGRIVFVGGVVVGFGAPLLAWATSRLDRRLLLSAALAIYAAGHLAAALAPGLGAQLALRALTMIGAAVFTPQAASTVALLVPPAERARAIAFIFIGWSLAAIAGLPLGRLAGALIGWRETYLIMGLASLAGAGWVWLALRPRLFTAPISLAAWAEVLRRPVLVAVLVVTLLALSGQFVLFSYATPLMTGSFHILPGAVAGVFLAMGATGILGNIVAGRLVRFTGIEATVHLALALIGAGLAVMLAFWGHAAAFVAGVALTGLGGFALNSMQQSRLVALAPERAAATVALNTAMAYLGQALGSSTGGWIMGQGASPVMMAAALAFILAAGAVSATLGRRRGF